MVFMRPALRGLALMARIAHTRHGVQVDAYNTATQSMERWQAQQVVVTLPVFVAARVVQNPPEFLRQAVQQAVQTLAANTLEHLARIIHESRWLCRRSLFWAG